MAYEHSTESNKPKNAIYSREELEALTTLHLREVCKREKLVVGAAYMLDRSYIINLILKHRGIRLNTFVNVCIPDRFSYVLDNLSAKLDFEKASASVQAPTLISLYRNLDTTVYDNYLVEGDIISEGNALLLNESSKVCGILNIHKRGEGFYITCKSDLISDSIQPSLYRNYSIGFLADNGSRYLYSYYFETQKMLPKKVKCYVKDITEFRFSEAKESATALIIDFGTSNSSAGAYIDEHIKDKHALEDLKKNGIKINEINKISFLNKDGQAAVLSEIVPTVVYVENCKDPSNIVYQFGFDAIRNAKREHFSGQASILYGIKKWINSYEKKEDISDNDGNIVSLARKEIMRAYFLWIIKMAQQQHKCLYTTIHITSPVKQKHQFLEMYEKMLPEYSIVRSTALDEGIAVLYNSISDQIVNQKFKGGYEYNALIIDCGGGTTDLTSCVYHITDSGITHMLEMSTTYANGETNFGGNNLTFRIFQLLKILLANYYSKNEFVAFGRLIDKDIDVYRHVDEYGAVDIYSKLEALYLETESVLPTHFAKYKARYADDYTNVKSNFYFLWNLAEKIKMDFYGNLSVIHTNFHKSGLTSQGHNKILSEESWMIYIYKDVKERNLIKNKTTVRSVLSLETNLPEVIITKEEISTLIKADIYAVIKKFIEPLYENGTLNSIDSIKLTGQTCKIDIFRDALKEFLPGLLIHSGKKDRSVNDLKLTCLEGAAKYQNAKRIGLIEPKIKNEAPVTPYRLIAFTHTNAERILIERSEKINKTYGFISRTIGTETVELMLLDANNRLLHKYPISTNIQGFDKTDYAILTSEFGEKIPQDDVDNIEDDEMKIFTFAFEDRWGFYVLPIARSNGQLLIGEKAYKPFEDDEWELNFFDGSK